MFETDKEVLEWYERQPRALSKEYVNQIRWKDVSNYPLNEAFVPVLFYMRDIEYFTDMYYRELMRTPTGRDPIIKRFMDRWSVEELHHGNLLNRFLEEAGYPTGKNWQADAMRKIPRSYLIGSWVADHASRPFGTHFHAAHMVWGTINEVTAVQAYRKLGDIAGHPVLKQLVMGIVQEESIHASFYWNIARLKLAEKKFARGLATVHHRQVLDTGWSGSKKESTKRIMFCRLLFKGVDGLKDFNRTVAARIERLPGFAGFNGLTEKIAGGDAGPKDWSRVLKHPQLATAISLASQANQSATVPVPAGIFRRAVAAANATKSEDPPHFNGNTTS